MRIEGLSGVSTRSLNLSTITCYSDLLAQNSPIFRLNLCFYEIIAITIAPKRSVTAALFEP